jgi:hypothetical protein
VLDRGGVEVAVVVFVAMSVTLFLTRESLVVVQAGISLRCSSGRPAVRRARPGTLEDALSAPASPF